MLVFGFAYYAFVSYENFERKLYVDLYKLLMPWDPTCGLKIGH